MARIEQIFSCKLHGPYTKKLSINSKRSKECQKCVIERKAKLDLSRSKGVLLERLKSKLGAKVILVGEFLGNRTSANFKCSKHGNFFSKPGVIKRSKYGCPFCGTEGMASKDKDKSRFKLEDLLKGKKGGKVTLAGEYTGLGKSTKFCCSKHGIFTDKPSRIEPREWACPECAKDSGEVYSKGISDDLYKKRLKVIHGDKISIKSYTDMRTPANFHCKNCKHEWVSLPTVLLGSDCPNCSITKIFALKDYSLGSRIVQVQGYEPWALTYLLNKGESPEGILVSKEKCIPIIYYKHGKTVRRHYPDIFIPKKKLLIEVKGLATFGLLNTFHNITGRQMFNKNKCKMKGAIAQGYKYRLMLFHNGKRIKLPKDWHERNYKDIRDLVLSKIKQ